MKEALCVTVAAVLAAVSSLAQGQFTFANKNLNTTPPINAPITCGGIGLAGSAYWAQAYIKLATDPDSSYAAVGAAVNFRTGAAAGYIVPVVVTTTYPNNTAVTVQMRVWDASGGPSYEAAVASGKCYGLSIGVELKVAEAPTPPADMIGLQSFDGFCCIPEPSSLALAALGATVLWSSRRRKACVGWA